MVISQNTGPQKKSNFPVALELFQVSLFTKKATKLHPYKTDRKYNIKNAQQVGRADFLLKNKMKLSFFLSD